MSERWPTMVLGGSGYVAGELLRLTTGHPHLDLRACVSSSVPGQPALIFALALTLTYPEPCKEQTGSIPLSQIYQVSRTRGNMSRVVTKTK